MFNSRLMRQEDALLQFELMAWLINRYEPPELPTVPSKLHRHNCLSELCWQNDRAIKVTDWAEDVFTSIKRDCLMDDWSIVLAPANLALRPSKNMIFAQSWNINQNDPYIIDGYGRPVIHYDTRLCHQPGYLSARLILKLAEIRLMNFTPEYGINPLMAGILTLTTACYMRQGFALAAMPRIVSDYLTQANGTKSVPDRVIANTLAFSTSLVILAKGQSMEQMFDAYGHIMTKDFSKKIKHACKQIQNSDVELKLLSHLSNPPRYDYIPRSYEARKA